MDFTTITHLFLTRADEFADAAAHAWKQGDRQQAERFMSATSVYDDAAMKLMALTAPAGH